jgi:methionine aminopeptidase
MAKDFTIVGGINGVPTVKAVIASATVIEAGDLVTLDTGLIIKAVAASTALAYAPNGSANGETEIEVTVGNDFLLEGTADANFAVTNKGTEVDLVGTTNLLIDLGESATDVLKVDISKDAGTVGSTANVRVKINKPLF